MSAFLKTKTITSGQGGQVMDYVLAQGQNETVEFIEGDPDALDLEDQFALEDGNKFGLVHAIYTTDGELTPDQLDHMRMKMREEFGIPADAPSMLVRHEKVGGDGVVRSHYHEVTVGRDDQGRVIDTYKSKKRDELVSRMCEVDFGMKLVPGRHNDFVYKVAQERNLDQRYLDAFQPIAHIKQRSAYTHVQNQIALRNEFSLNTFKYGLDNVLKMDRADQPQALAALCDQFDGVSVHQGDRGNSRILINYADDQNYNANRVLEIPTKDVRDFITQTQEKLDELRTGQPGRADELERADATVGSDAGADANVIDTRATAGADASTSAVDRWPDATSIEARHTRDQIGHGNDHRSSDAERSRRPNQAAARADYRDVGASEQEAGSPDTQVNQADEYDFGDAAIHALERKQRGPDLYADLTTRIQKAVENNKIAERRAEIRSVIDAQMTGLINSRDVRDVQILGSLQAIRDDVINDRSLALELIKIDDAVEKKLERKAELESTNWAAFADEQQVKNDRDDGNRNTSKWALKNALDYVESDLQNLQMQRDQLFADRGLNSNDALSRDELDLIFNVQDDTAFADEQIADLARIDDIEREQALTLRSLHQMRDSDADHEQIAALAERYIDLELEKQDVRDEHLYAEEVSEKQQLETRLEILDDNIQDLRDPQIAIAATERKVELEDRLDVVDRMVYEGASDHQQSEHYDAFLSNTRAYHAQKPAMPEINNFTDASQIDAVENYHTERAALADKIHEANPVDLQAAAAHIGRLQREANSDAYDQLADRAREALASMTPAVDSNIDSKAREILSLDAEDHEHALIDIQEYEPEVYEAVAAHIGRLKREANKDSYNELAERLKEKVVNLEADMSTPELSDAERIADLEAQRELLVKQFERADFDLAADLSEAIQTIDVQLNELTPAEPDIDDQIADLVAQSRQLEIDIFETDDLDSISQIHAQLAEIEQQINELRQSEEEKIIEEIRDEQQAVTDANDRRDRDASKHDAAKPAEAGRQQSGTSEGADRDEKAGERTEQNRDSSSTVSASDHAVAVKSTEQTLNAAASQARNQTRNLAQGPVGGGGGGKAPASVAPEAPPDMSAPDAAEKALQAWSRSMAKMNKLKEETDAAMRSASVPSGPSPKPFR